MKLMLRLATFAALVSLPFAVPASAQYIYLDSNANGVRDAGDRMNANGTPTIVDVYINTNHNPDGSVAVCDADAAAPLDFSAYAINLFAVNGTVTYSGFINQQATFTTAAPIVNPDGIRYKNGFAGQTGLPGGLFKACTLTIQ